MKRIYTRIGTSLLATAAVAAGTVGVSSVPAHALPTCTPVYSGPTYSEGTVSVEGFTVCDNPEDSGPIPVTLQRLHLTVWVTVATGLGEAQYECAGTSRGIYRLAARPTARVTLNCS
jgi:hypothetical protein